MSANVDITINCPDNTTPDNPPSQNNRYYIGTPNADNYNTVLQNSTFSDVLDWKHQESFTGAGPEDPIFFLFVPRGVVVSGNITHNGGINTVVFGSINVPEGTIYNCKSPYGYAVSTVEFSILKEMA